MVLGEAMLPADHLHLAIFRGNYADVLRRQGEFTSAIRQLDLALPVLIATLGEEHSRVSIFRQRRQWSEQQDRAAY